MANYILMSNATGSSVVDFVRLFALLTIKGCKIKGQLMEVRTMLKYDVRTGVKKIKTKTFVAISTVGLLLGGGGISLAIFSTAHAATPGMWTLHAPNALIFNCGGGNYNHTLNTVSEDSNGAFTGTGSYDPDHSYTWNITGNVSGSNITYTVVYTGSNSGYTLHGNGTIANDGSVSGSVDNNCQTFTMPAGTATFTPTDFSASQNLRDSNCSLTRSSKEVVDVNYKLINDYDSAVHGNAWANDTIHRHLDIWNVSENTYCAIVRDDGTFVTFAGDSPNGTGHVGAGIIGEMDGGYRTTLFTGTFTGNSTYKVHGNLGTFDLMCTNAYNCPGSHPSYLSYFSATSGDDLAWWGWEYNTCSNGNWINSIDANIGDITGNATAHQKRCFEDNDKHHHDNDKHHDRDEDNDNHHDLGPSA